MAQQSRASCSKEATWMNVYHRDTVELPQWARNQTTIIHLISTHNQKPALLWVKNERRGKSGRWAIPFFAWRESSRHPVRNESAPINDDPRVPTQEVNIFEKYIWDIFVVRSRLNDSCDLRAKTDRNENKRLAVAWASPGLCTAGKKKKKSLY